MHLTDIVAWVKSNQIIIGLVFSAIVGTMPETLPSLRAFPQWAWTWFHEASKTFLNFKKGVPPTEPTKATVTTPQQLNG